LQSLSKFSQLNFAAIQPARREIQFHYDIEYNNDIIHVLEYLELNPLQIQARIIIDILSED